MLQHMNIISPIQRIYWASVLLILASCFTITHTIQAQTPSPFPTRVSAFEGLKKDDLLNAVKSWLGQQYNGYPHQVHQQDSLPDQLRASSTFFMNKDVLQPYRIEFSVLISVKDGKMKTDFVAMEHFGKITNGGSLAQYSPTGESIGTARWAKIRDEGFRTGERYIDDLEAYIRKTASAPKW
jgi:hypothetical protein